MAFVRPSCVIFEQASAQRRKQEHAEGFHATQAWLFDLESSPSSASDHLQTGSCTWFGRWARPQNYLELLAAFVT